MNDQLLILAIGIPLIFVVMLIIRAVAGKKPEGEIAQQEYSRKIVNHPIFKIAIAAVFLLNFAVMVWTFSIGAYVLAVRTLGTLLIMVIIMTIVWLGMKKGWTEKTWKMVAGLMLIVGLLILLWGYLR